MSNAEAIRLAKIAAEAIANGHSVRRLAITARSFPAHLGRSKKDRIAAQANIKRRLEIADREKRRAA